MVLIGHHGWAMNPRNRNALLALVVIMIMLAIVMPLARREGAKPPVQSPPVSKSRVAHPARHGEFRAYTGPTTNFLGQDVPLAAVPYLASAVRCAKQVQIETAKYPSNDSRHQMLQSLERRLFEDDYAYAALVAGGMDRTNALEAFARIDQQPVPAKGAPLPPTEAATQLEHYYANIVDYGHSSGYSNVVQTLAKYTDRNPLQTDLFKDAALIPVEENQFNGWKDRFHSETDPMRAVQAEQFKDNPEALAGMQAALEAGQQGYDDTMSQLKESYRSIFAYRLAERDGLTDRSLINALAAIKLPNAGPELIIPTVE
jgi:hypothetical protein